MGKARLILGLLALVACQIVAAVEPVFAPDSEASYARTLVPRKGKAIVYIYMRQQDGNNTSPKIWLNNYEIGRLVPGSFTVWQLAPGRLQLKVGGIEPSTVSLISQAGKIYMFRLVLSHSELGTKAEIEKMPSSSRSELAATGLIKNPRQVTPVAAPVVQAKPATPPPVTEAESTPSPTPRQHERHRTRDNVRPGGMAVMLKTGGLSISKQSQTILGYDSTFDKSASGIYGFEVYYQSRSGVAMGGEFLAYKAHFTTVGLSASGDVSTMVGLFSVKRYFRTESSFQPYIGVGTGIAITSLSGTAFTGNTAGVAYALDGGLEYRTQSVGAFAEARYIYANTKDKNSQSIDMTSSGFMAGVVFHF